MHPLTLRECLQDLMQRKRSIRIQDPEGRQWLPEALLMHLEVMLPSELNRKGYVVWSKMLVGMPGESLGGIFLYDYDGLLKYPPMYSLLRGPTNPLLALH